MGYTFYGRVNVTHSLHATKHNVKDKAVVLCHVETVCRTGSFGILEKVSTNSPRVKTDEPNVKTNTFKISKEPGTNEEEPKEKSDKTVESVAGDVRIGLNLRVTDFVITVKPPIRIHHGIEADPQTIKTRQWWSLYRPTR